MVRQGGAGSGHAPLGSLSSVGDSGTRAEARRDGLSQGYLHDEQHKVMTGKNRLP